MIYDDPLNLLDETPRKTPTEYMDYMARYNARDAARLTVERCEALAYGRDQGVPVIMPFSGDHLPRQEGAHS